MIRASAARPFAIFLLSAATPAAGRAGTLPGQEVKQATAVKERHERKLLRLPAVVGVGVGESAARPGKAAILIFVSRKLTGKEQRLFPKELEGVAVEVQVSGPIVALPEDSGKQPKHREPPARKK